MEPLVVPLAATSRADRARVGGKGAHLGELLRAGFAVPDGFCLTAEAYRLHLREAGLDAQGGAGSRELLAAFAREMRAAIAEHAVPTAVADAVKRALATLDGELAVRSSALDEDAAAASFAGQHETVLGVRGLGAVLDAVRACWASLWSPRALEYRAGRALDAAAEMACVIQRMVPAEAAGVLFTADPITGERDRVVVNVVRGLGEALVSGRVSAVQVVLSRDDGRVVEGDGAALPVPPAELARIARDVEAHFSAPQDVEWAVDEGRVFLLQARPITNLPPEPVRLEDAQRPILYYPERVKEMMPGPITPLTADFALHAVARGVEQNLVRHRLLPRALAGRMQSANAIVDGRIYIDLALLREGFLPGLDELAIVELVESGRRPPLRALRFSMLLRGARGGARAAVTGARMLRRLDALAEKTCRDLDALLAPLEREDLSRWSDDELTGLLRLRHPPDMLERIVATPPANPVARMMAAPFYTALERLATRWGGEPRGAAAVLVSALPGLPEVECAQALWALADHARAVPAVRAALERDPAPALDALAALPEAQPWLASFGAFLDRFGHRAIEEVELARPRWREQPAYPLGVIASYLRLPAESSPEAIGSRQRQLCDETEARIRARLRRRPLRRRVFAFVLDVVRQASTAGETTKFQIVRLLALVRAAALELGRRRVAAGRLQSAEDVFFLRYEELEGGDDDLRARVVARREEHRRQQAQDAPRLIDARHRPVRERRRVREAPPAEGELHGIAASPGVVRGPVRVLLDPSGGFDLRPGEILVAPFTDPAWTPLFLAAAAVVVETGSLLSHASIVARELGRPSVVAVPGVTRLLHDGQQVEVDGTRGLVRVL